MDGIIKNINWMTESEKIRFKNSNCYEVIKQFIDNNNLSYSAINAFNGLDTKRTEVLVSQFINRCEAEAFLALLEAYQNDAR